jgi:hypothetical protein
MTLLFKLESRTNRNIRNVKGVEWRRCYFKNTCFYDVNRFPKEGKKEEKGGWVSRQVTWTHGNIEVGWRHRNSETCSEESWSSSVYSGRECLCWSFATNRQWLDQQSRHWGWTFLNLRAHPVQSKRKSRLKVKTVCVYFIDCKEIVYRVRPTLSKY